MVKYTVFRIAFLLLTLIMVITVLFFIARFITIRDSDAPFMDKFVQITQEYVVYLRNVVTSWDWGTTEDKNPAWEQLLDKVGLTLRLTIFSFVVYTTLGILLGTLAAIYKERLLDKIVTFFILIFSSIPAFIMVMLLIIFFGYYLEWLPPINPSITFGFWQYQKGIIIPVLAISGLPLARFTRLIRGEMNELYNSEYLLLLKTKGLSNRQAITKHFLKDSFVTLLPEMMPMIIYVLVTSFIVEKVYNVQGIANWLFDSIFKPYGDTYFVLIDLPSMVIIGGFYTAITLMAGLIIDLLSVNMDPRIRLDDKNINGV